MAHKFYDRIFETSRSTGVGSFALDGAVSGYHTFGHRYAEGESFVYLIDHKLFGQWEIGVGYYQTTDTGTGTAPGLGTGTGTGPGAILLRDSVIASSNNDDFVDFPEGVKNVQVVLSARQALQADTETMGVFGQTPSSRVPAYTQTYVTATRTHAALTSTALVDSTGGSANTTLVDVTTATLADPVKCNDNFADLVAQINALRADLENAKQVLNQVIDDQQSYGWFQ